ncbi:hypothetical protein GOODEAATRI_021431 [Goodea atripinnis]|uniref:L-serine ammonia-lyase n=1 Tax=Goodea atripinnis TaxID=208336 RepID=A0ABV0N387_9TELE
MNCTMSERFHLNTPLLESVSMSKQLGTTVYLKMENSQPSGSFKIRGIGHFCQQVGELSNVSGTPISCGNAGMAAAFVARKMGLPATVVVPSSTSQLVVRRLQDQGATVRIVGKVNSFFPQASRLLCNRLKMFEVFQEHHRNSRWQPFQNTIHRPGRAEGHASLIVEAAASLGPGVKPGAVLLSVGGGGLLCGVIHGLKDVGWMDVPIIAVETVGADCFNAAIKAGKVVTLVDITRLV